MLCPGCLYLQFQNTHSFINGFFNTELSIIAPYYIKKERKKVNVTKYKSIYLVFKQETENADETKNPDYMK